MGSKVINLYSVLFLVINLGALALAYPLLAVAAATSAVFDRVKRRPIDAVVQLWARVCLIVFFWSVPKLVNAEKLPPRGQAALYAPNHCSFLDIFALSAAVPRPLKYVSKAEILRIPFIGWAMQLAGHIALRRGSRKSQLQTFREAVDSLKAGNNLVTFPEGTRSPTGVLRSFKNGPFKMAASAGVPVVPVSVVRTGWAMPVAALLPIRPAWGVKVVIHDPIDPSEVPADEIVGRTRAAINSGLPTWMRSES